MKIIPGCKNTFIYKLCGILLICITGIFISSKYDDCDYTIIEKNKFENCLFTKWKDTRWKDTECTVNIGNYAFNLTNCDYYKDFWNFCNCCPKATLLENKLESRFCLHEGTLEQKSGYGNFTAKCGLELFEPI